MNIIEEEEEEEEVFFQALLSLRIFTFYFFFAILVDFFRSFYQGVINLCFLQNHQQFSHWNVIVFLSESLHKEKMLLSIRADLLNVKYIVCAVSTCAEFVSFSLFSSFVIIVSSDSPLK